MSPDGPGGMIAAPQMPTNKCRLFVQYEDQKLKLYK